MKDKGSGNGRRKDYEKFVGVKLCGGGRGMGVVFRARLGHSGKKRQNCGTHGFI